jgi:type I restriction-modification system DNA methylase subunit
MAKAAKEVKDEQLEKQLWKAADKLRKNIDSAEYKHVVLGLIFLKPIKRRPKSRCGLAYPKVDPLVQTVFYRN